MDCRVRCDLCNKSFTQWCNFSRHRAAKHGEEKFVCRICGNKFCREQLLKNHLRMHETALRNTKNTSDNADEENVEENAAPPSKRMRLSEDNGIQQQLDKKKESCKAREPVNKERSVETTVEKQQEKGKSDGIEKAVVVAEEQLPVGALTKEANTEVVETLFTDAREAEADTAEEPAVKTAESVAKDGKIKKIVNKLAAAHSFVTEVKVMASLTPIPLYPPPKFKENAPKLSLDFFRRFKRSFDKMTKNDLEELVLQKIVEAIVHKSEFAEMREIVEKQEKIILSHRNKITELSMQFRDLEMVHHRVVKDIALKNSQFIRPLKIIRAVGVQIYIPNKKLLENSLHVPANGSVAVNAATSTAEAVGIAGSPVLLPSTNSSSPKRTSPQRQPGSADATSSTSTRLPSNALASAAAAAAINARRGCARKITPKRPIEPTTNTYRPGNIPTASQMQNAPPKVLNKGMAPAVIPLQRGRYTAPDLQRLEQLSRPQLATHTVPVHLRKIPVRMTLSNTPAQQQPPSQQLQGIQYRRSESSPALNNSASGNHNLAEGYLSSLSAGVAAAIRIPPAKRKHKAIIDLTDEDDIVQPQVQPTTATTIRQRLPVQQSTTYMQQPRTVPPLTRMPGTGQASNGQASNGKTISARPLASLQAQRPNSSNSALFSNISTPPGTNITRVQLGSSVVSGSVTHQIYAYQESSDPPSTDPWRHVGDD